MTSTSLDRREGTAPPSGRDILLLAQIVDLVRTGVANTRPDLEQATGLGRTVVHERLREGMDLGILEEGGTAQAERGRPSRTVRFRSEAGLILTAGFADNSVWASVSDLDGTSLARVSADADVLDGPDVVLPIVEEQFRTLLKRMARGRAVWGVALGLPGPVDFASGRMVAPPIMHGWDGYDVRGWFRNRYEAPVWVDNDDNLRAFGEWAMDQPHDVRDLLYVEIGEGIGSGLVTGGRLHRGDTGAAGDIGHFRVTDDPTAVCRCGRIGCLAAVASGWGLSRILTAAAERGDSPMLAVLAREGRIAGHELAAAIAAGDPVTMEAVRRAARLTGLTVAGLVNFANPGTLVLGGSALRGTDVFFETFKAAVLEQTIELAASRLVIRPSTADFEVGTVGGALLVVRRLFRQDALQLWLAAGTPIGSAVRIQQLA